MSRNPVAAREQSRDVRTLGPGGIYPALVSGRGIVEHAIVDEIDPNSWEVCKAPGLLSTSNVAVGHLVRLACRARVGSSARRW